MMRYELNFDEDKIIDIEAIGDDGVLDLNDCCKIMNEQQATNDYLEEANSRLQIQLGETLRLVDEQQATINRLQEENESLKQRIRDIKYNGGD